MTDKTPVSMLSGFLGSGKTTLLRYLLENSTEKIACIVNDVAAVNIDAKLLRNDRNKGRSEQNNSTTDLADTIELANGCACCNASEELFASFEQLLALAAKNGKPYTRIILENSGVAEPQAIRDKFSEAEAAGHPLMQSIYLDTLVTVVDAGTFITDYASKAPLAARPELGEGGNLRPVVDLLVEQVEVADFIVLNKTDMLDTPEKLDQLVAIAVSLNPLATVIPCQQGQVPIDKVFGKTTTAVISKLNVEGQHRGAVAAARALAVKAQETSAAIRFGIKSFVYERRKPFHPQRLKEMVLKWLPVTHNKAIDGEAASIGDSPIKTVLRSKGFMWLSNSHSTAYYWSHAGQHFEIKDEGDWWAAVPEEDWPGEEAQRAVVMEDFDKSGAHGDRRQEIVFIGVGMDEALISVQLDGALLTDEEMDKYGEYEKPSIML
eukprot:gene11382-12082_t